MLCKGTAQLVVPAAEEARQHALDFFIKCATALRISIDKLLIYCCLNLHLLTFSLSSR